MMIVYPDLGAHINAIDDRLAPHAQIGNQFIDGRDLIDFCAGGALVPNGSCPRSMTFGKSAGVAVPSFHHARLRCAFVSRGSS
jgi:hypothetical protein